MTPLKPNPLWVLDSLDVHHKPKTPAGSIVVTTCNELMFVNLVRSTNGQTLSWTTVTLVVCNSGHVHKHYIILDANPKEPPPIVIELASI